MRLFLTVLILALSACSLESNLFSEPVTNKALEFTNARLETIQDLKNYPTLSNCVEVLGYFTVGDGGGGFFCWSLDSAVADDGGLVIQSIHNSTGRWMRQLAGPIDVRWFGPKAAPQDPCKRRPQGYTDAIQRAVNAAINIREKYHTRVDLAGCRYEVDSPINVETARAADTVVPFELVNGSILYTGNLGPAIYVRGKNPHDYFGLTLRDFSISYGGTTPGLIGMRIEKAIQGHFNHIRVTGFTGPGAIGLLLSGTTGGRFFDCNISGNSTNLRFQGHPSADSAIPCNENKFYGCRFSSATADGIASVYFQYQPESKVGSPGNNNGFYGCWIENNAVHGMVINGGLYTIIEGTRFEGIGIGTNYIRIEPPSTGLVRNIRILNNYFSTASQEGIYIGPGVQSTRIAFNEMPSANFIKDNSQGKTEIFGNWALANSFQSPATTFQTGTKPRLVSGTPNGPFLTELVAQKSGLSTEETAFLEVSVPASGVASIVQIDYIANTSGKYSISGQLRFSVARYNPNYDTVVSEIETVYENYLQTASTATPGTVTFTRDTFTESSSSTQTFRLKFKAHSEGATAGYLKYTAKILSGASGNSSGKSVTLIPVP